MTLGLTVLGGSAAWPNPGQGCSSYLVTSAYTSILLDCGPNTLLELREQIDYTTISAVVLSHCHADHMLDLVPYRYGLKYGPVRPTQRIPLWLPPGGSDRLQMLAAALAFGSEDSSAFWTDVFDLHEYQPGHVLGIGSLTIAFAPTQHYVPCYAMLVSNVRGDSIGYSADTGTIEPLVELMAGASLVLVEATERAYDDGPIERRGHLTPEDAGRLAAGCAARTLVVTHLWSERSDDEVIRAAASYFDGQIVVAKRGLHVNI